MNFQYVHQTKPTNYGYLTQSDKWILPRNVVVDSLLSMNVTGYQTFLTFIPEWLLRHFFYRDLADLAPDHKGLFTQTPMCNDQILSEIRAGKAHWQRGDILGFEEDGINFNLRQQGIPAGGPGKKIFVSGDIFIYATGFTRPDPHFLPDEAFETPYEPPAWYLQTFPPEYPKVCAINSMYINAIGTVGHVHIGLYTRTLLMFLRDERTMPTPKEMKRWVDFTRWLKRRAPGNAFDFFTYSEMMLWFVECIAWNPARWYWVVFVFLGWEVTRQKEVQVNGIK